MRSLLTRAPVVFVGTLLLGGCSKDISHNKRYVFLRRRDLMV